MARDFSVARLFTTCLLAALFAAPVCAQGPESRIWTDQSGKFEIRAKFVDVVDGQVRVERPNGDITRVPLEKLSQADQDYVNGQGKSAPAPPAQPAAPEVRGLQVGDKVEAEHFGKWRPATVVEIDYKWERVRVQIDGESKHDWPMRLEELRYPGTLQRPILVRPPDPVSALKTIRPDYTDMKRLLADGKAADHVAAEPLDAPATTWEPRAVRVGAEATGFVLPSDMAGVRAPTAVALLVYESPHDDEDARVELIDLEQRTVLLSGPAPPGTGKVAMSPSGTSVATFPDEMGGNDSTGRVDCWKITDKKISHWISFSPYVMNTWPDLDPKWCAWLDDERLLTLNDEGQLFLWEVEDAKAIYELQLDGRSRPILTHGRKHLVVPTSAGVQFVDAESGELAAVLGSGDYLGSDLALSPTGKQLAVAKGGFIDVLDVTTGETVRSFPCEGVGGSRGISWIDEEYLFTPSGLVIHAPLRLVVWKYEINSRLVKAVAGTHWAVLGIPMTGDQVLTPLELPPQEAIDALADLDEDGLLVVRPGEAIRIEVQIQGDNFLAESVKQALAEALQEANMRVDDQSPLKLVARTKTGKTQKIEYHMFGAFRQSGETVEVTTRIYELELLLDGVPVWKRESFQMAPMHLHLEQGESIHSAIERVMKPTAANVRGRLPSYVVSPEYREPQGTSKLSLD